MICLISALVIIEEVSAEFEEELMAEPMDEEVLVLEEAAAVAAEQYATATEWTGLPGAVKVLLVFDAILMQASVFMMVGSGQHCWESVGLLPEVPCPAGTSSTLAAPCGPIDGPPLNGSLANLVRPLGWIALAMHFSAVILHSFVFGTWASSATKKVAAAAAVEGNDAKGQPRENDVDASTVTT